MTTFLEAVRPYQNSKTGMVSLYPDDGVIDNFHYITAHAIALGERLGEDVSLLRHYAIHFAMLSMFPNSGLLRRRPDDNGATSYDECFGGARSSSYIAGKLIKWGRNHWWCYDVENPGRLSGRFFFARNIGFIPFLYKRARDRTNILGQLAWSVGLLLSLLTPKDNTSGKLLMDLQIEPMRAMWLCRQFIKFWEWRMSKQYPGGRRELYSIFMPTNHPLATFQKESFDV